MATKDKLVTLEDLNELKKYNDSEVNDLKSDLEDNLEPYGMYNRYSLGSGFSATAIQTANNNGIEVTIISPKSFMLNGTATGGFSMMLQKKYPVSGTLYMTLKCSDENVRSSYFYYNVGYFDSNNTMHQGLKTLYLGATDVEVVYPDNAVENRDFIYIQPNAVFDNAVFSFEANTKAEPVFVEDINESIDHTKSYSFLPVSTGYKTYIEYNSVSETITVPRDIVAVGKDLSYVSSQYLDYRTLNQTEPKVFTDVNYATYGTSVLKLVVDIGTKEMALLPSATAKNTEAQRLIAMIRLKAGPYPGGISSPFPWSIDGKPYGIDIPPFTYENNSLVKSIAHRGYYTCPENTIISYVTARKNGFVNGETDVQFTSDGVAVLLHDATINRTARNDDGTELSETVYIRDITYEQALTYDFGIYKGEQFSGTRIATLDEFCDTLRKIGMKPYVELKAEGNFNETKINQVINIVNKYGLLEDTVFISANFNILNTLKGILPSTTIILGYAKTLVQADVDKATQLKTGTNTVIISNDHYSDSDVALCKESSIPLYVFEVETPTAILNTNPYVSGFVLGRYHAGKVLYEEGIS